MKQLWMRSLLLAFLMTPLSLAAQQTPRDAQSSSRDAIWDRIDNLEFMITMWPRQEYYLQLASLYGRVGDFDRQLELYEISNAMGWLIETEQFIQVARLLLRANRTDEIDEFLRKALEKERADSRRDGPSEAESNQDRRRSE